MAENPVNPDADRIGQSPTEEPITLGRAGSGKRRLNAAYVASGVVLALAVLAALLTLTDVL